MTLTHLIESGSRAGFVALAWTSRCGCDGGISEEPLARPLAAAMRTADGFFSSAWAKTRARYLLTYSVCTGFSSSTAPCSLIAL